MATLPSLSQVATKKQLRIARSKNRYAFSPLDRKKRSLEHLDDDMEEIENALNTSSAFLQRSRPTTDFISRCKNDEDEVK